MDEPAPPADPAEAVGDADEPGIVTARAPIDLDRLVSVEAELADVEHALARLDAGTYGTCEICTTPLEEGRLIEAPATRTCGAHT